MRPCFVPYVTGDGGAARRSAAAVILAERRGAPTYFRGGA
jgi:hypothetical protein